MPTVLLCLSPSASSEAAQVWSTALSARGFKVLVEDSLQLVPKVVESAAQTGGRIDAIALIATDDQILTSIHLVPIVEKIRGFEETVAFLSAVRARTVPIVLMCNPANLGHERLPKWVRVVDIAESVSDTLATEVLASITEWRQNIVEDLDSCGYAVSFTPDGGLEVNHALVRKRRSGQILTPEATPGSLRTGQYLILAQDILEEFAPYRELEYLLNHHREIATKEGLRPEDVFQRFFEKHPQLLLQDGYDRHWPQPRLIVPTTKQVLIPDFVLRPRATANVGTTWKILDLKQPDEPLIAGPKLHKRISASVLQAVEQLENYRRVFNSPEAQDMLLSRFEAQPLNPRVAVLIGRRDQLDDAGVLDRAQSDRFSDVEILSYDQVADIEANRLAQFTELAKLFR